MTKPPCYINIKWLWRVQCLFEAENVSISLIDHHVSMNLTEFDI